MYFLTDRYNKVIFGWSAKCGCTHIKNIFYFLTGNRPFTDLHRQDSYGDLPKDYHDYTIIIVTRNPFERIVSGFKEKYMEGKFKLKGYDRTSLTFNQFTEELVENKFKNIELHHFTHQLSEKWRDELSSHKNIKFYDLNFIDYGYISSLYKGRVITEDVKNFRGTHNISKKITGKHENPVYDSPYALYMDKKVEVSLFYNDVISQRIKSFFMKDFDFFRSVGINYELESVAIDKPFMTTPSLERYFTFYKNKDHIGSDMFCVGKDLDHRIKLLTALNTPGCKGFNTLGFMKNEINVDALVKSNYFSEDDGIYVKID